jgi:hypothetical protein
MPHGSITERTCRHWRGCMIRLCGAGLVPRDLAAGPNLGWVLRVPCAGRHGRGGMPWNPCEKYSPAKVSNAEGAENAE